LGYNTINTDDTLQSQFTAINILPFSLFSIQRTVGS